MSQALYHLPLRLDRLQRFGLIIGVVGLALGIIGGFMQPAQFFNAWHYAFFFCIGIPLGGLAITMLHHLTGGNWGLAIRRECEAAALTLPLMALLFIPIALGTRHLFPWASAELVRDDKILQHQSIYFNNTWFILRAVIYFAVWIVLATLLGRASLEYERTDDFRIVRRIRKISAGGFFFLVVTISLAAVDWVMSREMHFYSTIIGFIVAVGMALSALVLVVALLRILSEEEDLRNFLSGDVLNDLGNLIFTLVILWAYMSFSQLLIIWMGNISHETPWYIHRGIGQQLSPWRFVALLLLIFHFVVPFLLLLSRDAKRDLRFLSALAAMILVMRALDVYWLIAPSSGPNELRPRVSWMDLPLVVGMFGLWFAVFVAMLRRRPLVARVEMDEEEAAAAAAKAAHHNHSHGGAAGASPVA
jgi:hypothetical protein